MLMLTMNSYEQEQIDTERDKSDQIKAALFVFFKLPIDIELTDE